MSFTNQMLGALGTATGALAAGKHIAEQREQKAISSVGQLDAAYRSAVEAVDQSESEVRVAKNQKEQARINYNNSIVELNNARALRSDEEIKSDISSNEMEQQKLLDKIKEFNNKYDPENGGNGIPSKAELAYNTRRMNNLEALRKARNTLGSEQEARNAMISEVNSRKIQLNNARADESQARHNAYNKKMELDNIFGNYKKMGGNE